MRTFKEIHEQAEQWVRDNPAADKTLAYQRGFIDGVREHSGIMYEQPEDVATEESSFLAFWNAYDKKVGREKSEKLWTKLSPRDKNACLAYIPDYVKATPDKTYRKNPETFLRNHSWNDEIINHSNNNKPHGTAQEQELAFMQEQSRVIFGKDIQG